VSLPSNPARVLVLDTMCLSHFTLADRLDVLQDSLIDLECWTTRVVIEELRAGSAAYPALSAAGEVDWLSVAQLAPTGRLQLGRPRRRSELPSTR
jgi:hypothetical protein